MSETRRGRDGRPSGPMFTDEAGNPTPPEPPAPPKNQAGGEVIVATNLPMGMRLQVFTETEQWAAGTMGGRVEKIWRPAGKEYVARGNAVDIARVTSGQVELPETVNTYAFTRGIPRDFWEAWLEQNREMPYVVNNCIFAEPDESRIRARARGLGKQLSGLERIDRSNPSSKSRELQGAFSIQEMTRADE